MRDTIYKEKPQRMYTMVIGEKVPRNIKVSLEFLEFSLLQTISAR